MEEVEWKNGGMEGWKIGALAPHPSILPPFHPSPSLSSILPIFPIGSLQKINFNTGSWVLKFSFHRL